MAQIRELELPNATECPTAVSCPSRPKCADSKGVAKVTILALGIVPDGIHRHPSMLALALRVTPNKCILITDKIELAGLPDSVHLLNGQIGYRQGKVRNKVVIDGTDNV